MNTPFREIPSDGNGAVDWHPGKLWSLWDIMKPFDAALFMKFMPFKVTSGKRAVRAAQSVGLDVRRLKIGKNGEIELDVGQPVEPDEPNATLPTGQIVL